MPPFNPFNQAALDLTTPETVEVILVDGDGERVPCTVYDVDVVDGKLRINAELARLSLNVRGHGFGEN